MKVSGFIFDMDGTVIDSTKHDFNAWKKVMHEKRIDFPYNDFLALLGAKGEEIVKKFLDIPKDQIDALLEKKEAVFQEIASLNGLLPMPGVVDFLEKIKAKGLRIALATGAGRTKLDYIFKRIEVSQYFQEIITANEIQKGKPDPEIFLKAAEKLGIRPEEAIVVEDAPNGLRAAKHAGMRCLAITSTHSRQSLQGADFIVDHYDDFDWNNV